MTVDGEQPRSHGSAMRHAVAVMLVAVLLYGAFAVWRGLDTMSGELGRFRWTAFVMACGLALGNYLVRWLKWEFYLARLQVQGVGRIDSLLTFLSGFVLTVTPGKVGEVFKSVVLYQTHGVPVARTAPVVVAERATDVIGVVVLITVGSAGFSGGTMWAGIGATLVALLLVAVSNRRLAHALIGTIERGPGAMRRMGPKLRVAYDSLATLLRPRNLVVPTALSVGAWSLECAALWVVLHGLGQPVPFELATFFYATSTLAGAIVPVPGGLGVTETSLQGQLQNLGHVSAAGATAGMILVRLATLWFAVAVGFLSLSLLKRRHPVLLAGAVRDRLVAEPNTAP